MKQHTSHNPPNFLECSRVLGIRRGNFPSQQEVFVSGSKYLANRFLVGAALAEGESKLRNMPQNEDIEVASTALQAFGVGVRRQGNTLLVRGVAGKPQTPKTIVCTGNNGTFSRFVLPFAALCNGEVFLRSGPQMQRRPMLGLLATLEAAGVALEATNNTFPIRIFGRKGAPTNNAIEVDMGASSQFASALVLCGGFLTTKKKPITLLLRSQTVPVSKQYLEMTIGVVRSFGGIIERPRTNEVVVRPATNYKAVDLAIEGDMVSASYFMGMAMLGGKKLRISGLNPRSTYGENQGYSLFQSMGCPITVEGNSLVIDADEQTEPTAIDVHMEQWTDFSITIALCCAAAKGTCYLRRIGHLRHKESNRLEGIVDILRLLGVRVGVARDDLRIEGGRRPFPSVRINPKQDHRLAMASAMLCLLSPKVVVEDSRCVQKSFPDFWKVLSGLGCFLEAET